MKKFNITSNALATMALTCIVWLCVLFAAAYALQEPTNAYYDAICALTWLAIAGFFEWLKYRITHQEEYDDITQG